MGRAERILVGGCLLASFVAIVVGWKIFWFNCDDAYIAFRYVQNGRLGFGYVWNPPPFRAVEGYTSFLWVALLDGVWRVFEVAPPVAANRLSLAFSLATVPVVVAMAWTTAKATLVSRWRALGFALIVLAIVSNRTFLAWTSSGLETALFSFLLLSWVWFAVFSSRSSAQTGWLSALSALLALCRPDGLLFVAATVAMTFPDLRRRPLAAVPWLATAVHLGWRRLHYGFWLPNTHQAKVVAPWPVGGVMHAANFVFEYAYWIWLFLAVSWLGHAIAGHPLRKSVALAFAGERRLPAGAIAALVVHLGYYVVVVGGDHFEYRIFHHLVPLVVVSFFWMAHRLGRSARTTVASAFAMTLLGLVLPWTHWWFTHSIDVRRAKGMPHYRIAPHFPWLVRPYALAFDGLQEWILHRFIGIRHQSHKVFLANYQVHLWPSRAEGEAISGADHPVLEASAVGFPGWVLPHVAIVDDFGLNDAVIARAPVARAGQFERVIAHDRHPPPGYVECFRPNVKPASGPHVRVEVRPVPLTNDDIVACESRWWGKLGIGR